MYSLSTWSCPSSSQAQIPGERRPGQGSAEPTRRAPQAALMRLPRAGQSKPGTRPGQGFLIATMLILTSVLSWGFGLERAKGIEPS